MKKLFLLLSMISIVLGTMAEGQPNVIVHKSNGGFWAWLNLYNEITYTTSDVEGVPAQLNCFGSGFSACRLPRFSTYPSTAIPEVLSENAEIAITNAINELIAESELDGSKGVYSGRRSKTVAVARTSRKGFDTYFVNATWNYTKDGEGTMNIYVSQSNILNTK
ncbi:MAG: hypothetical protein MJZ57_01850 [Bacteroidales bacterium]|nr:hypothetical protein [Bacteroidales bacterium]